MPDSIEKIIPQEDQILELKLTDDHGVCDKVILVFQATSDSGFKAQLLHGMQEDGKPDLLELLRYVSHGIMSLLDDDLSLIVDCGRIQMAREEEERMKTQIPETIGEDKQD